MSVSACVRVRGLKMTPVSYVDSLTEELIWHQQVKFITADI